MKKLGHSYGICDILYNKICISSATSNSKKIADIYSLDFLLVERIIFSSISQDSMGTSINLLNSPASPLNSPPSKVTVWKNKVKPKSSKIRTIHTSALTQLA